MLWNKTDLDGLKKEATSFSDTFLTAHTITTNINSLWNNSISLRWSYVVDVERRWGIVDALAGSFVATKQTPNYVCFMRG
jgi:hypothetical protein